MVETLEIKVISTRYDPGAWVDASGNRWVMGEVTPSGYIVGNPGTFIAAGTVYIDEEELPDALEAGWRCVGKVAPNGLVQVEREYRGAADSIAYIRDPEHPERLPTAYSL
jgi:hypothetical protein